jgi:SRSO17 transposase
VQQSLALRRSWGSKRKQNFQNKVRELASDVIRHQVEQGISFEFISADGYYGNDASFARLIDSMGLLYMLDLHADQTIYLERPELEIPQRKSERGRKPQKLKANIISTTVKKYIDALDVDKWETLTVRNTAKGKLKGDYHFVKVYIWDKNTNAIEPRLLVIRKTISGKNTVEIKYSFTNANLDQYTPESLAYMQAQRFFVEHCLKESKQILGLDEFQTRMWNAWEHQVALNFMVSSFMLKEKLACFDDLPLLSARDIKEYLTFKLFKEMTEEQMIDRIYNRHIIRQRDINYSYLRE